MAEGARAGLATRRRRGSARRLAVVALLAVTCVRGAAWAQSAPSGDASALIEVWARGGSAFGVFVPSAEGAYTVDGAAALARNELLDFLFLDLERAYEPTAVDRLVAGLASVDRTERPALLVRLPTMDRDGAERTGQRVGDVLRRGADGIVFPHVRTPEMATLIGGFFEGTGAHVWSPDNPDGTIISMLMLEDREAVAAAGAVADLGGYSLLSCGIGSLRADVGSAEAAEEGCLRVKDHAARRGRPSMMIAFDGEALRTRIDQGYRGLLMRLDDGTRSLIVAGRAATGR